MNHYKIMSNTDTSEPEPIGSTTIQTDISQTQATYLPPSELAIKYAKGIHAYTHGTPHPSHTQPFDKGSKGEHGKGKGYPHLIKKIESFYVRPRWLFVRVSLGPMCPGSFVSRVKETSILGLRGSEALQEIA